MASKLKTISIMISKELRSMLLDKSSLIALLLVPLGLMGILGISLSGMFTVDLDNRSSHSTHMLVYVENNDKGQMGRFLADRALQEEHLDEYVIYVDETERAKAELLIIIPEDFTVKLFSGQQAPSVTFVTDRPERIAIQVIKTTIENFLRVSQVFQTAFESGILGATGNDVNIDTEIQQSFNEQMFDGMATITERSAISEDAGVISSFAYYALGMSLMYTLFLGSTATASFIRESNQQTMLRLRSTPQSVALLYTGKFIGWWMLAIWQFIILAGGSSLLFGVDWGNAYGKLMLIIACYAFVVIALASLAASFLTKLATADQVITVVVLLLAAAGGSMVPIYTLPDTLNQLARILPNALALQTTLPLLAGSAQHQVWQEALQLLGAGLVMLMLAMFRLRQRGEL